MRCLIVAAVLSAVSLLGAAAAAAAPPLHAGDGRHDAHGHAVIAEGLPGGLSPAGARPSPLARRVNPGAATLGGRVLRSDGAAAPEASVEWWGQDSAGTWYQSEGTADGSGWFAMAAMPTTNGEVYATYPDGGTTLGFLSQQWADGSTHDLSFLAGRVSVRADLGGPWASDFEYVAVRLWGADRYSYGQVPANGSVQPQGSVDANSGAYSSGSAKFFCDEGVEFTAPITVPAFGQAASGVAVSEAAAQRIWITSPYWDSGKPGSVVRVVRNNYPAGWVDQVSGYNDDPQQSGSRVFGDAASSGAMRQSLNVTVPAAAKPGYTYWIGFHHINGTLYLETPFQVCTMKPSRTRVRKGVKIRVKGVVPTAGNWGDGKGLRKVVTLYAHRGSARVPTKWNPKSQGWVKLGSVRTNGRGAYTTPYFRPLKTLTLIARYPGDDWYWGAFTSARKVTVR